MEFVAVENTWLASKNNSMTLSFPRERRKRERIQTCTQHRTHNTLHKKAKTNTSYNNDNDNDNDDSDLGSDYSCYDFNFLSSSSSYPCLHMAENLAENTKEIINPFCNAHLPLMWKPKLDKLQTMTAISMDHISHSS